MYRCVIFVAGVMLTGTLLFQQCGPSTTQPRNVVLISLDTCRADHLSCYGFPRNTTPNIDRIADEGVLFTNVMTPVPLTLPAHSSMLTGTIPPYHGIHANSIYKLDSTNLTLAEILRQNAFVTAGIISAFVLDSRFGLNQGFDYYNDNFQELLSTTGINERRGGEVSRIAVDWLEEHRRDKFFLFLHYYDPHKEYDPPEPFASDYSDDLYAGEIAYADFCIGQVIDKLKDLGLYESSLIIITGDHGEMLGEHREKGHGYFIYQSAIHVPLIFKLPGRHTAQKVNDLAGLIDIVPTVCQEMGIDIPVQVQGESLSRYFDEEPPAGQDRQMYCESMYPSRVGANVLLGIVDNRWKFIQTTRSELYDLIDDPDESNNLIEEMPQETQTMETELRQILAESEREDSAGDNRVLDEDSRRRLEALGYLTGTDQETDLEFDTSKEDPKDLIDLHVKTSEAQMLLFDRKYDEAKKMFEEILRIRPGFHSAYLYLGTIAKEKGDLDEALEYLREAIRLKPDEPEPHHQIGEILMQLGQYDEAADHFRETLKTRPDKIETLNDLGFLMTLKGRYDEAVEYLGKALEIDPNEVTALTNLGTSLLAQGKSDEAMVRFERVVELDSLNRRAHVSLGHILATKKEYDSAIGHFEKALKVDPNQVGVLDELGNIYYQKADIEQALLYWSRALELDGDQVSLLNSLAWIKAANADERFHDPQEAVRLALKACELSHYRDASIVNTLATAYAAAGNFTDAVAMAEKSLDLLRASGPPELITMAEESLELFRAGKAYRESP